MEAVSEEIERDTRGVLAKARADGWADEEIKSELISYLLCQYTVRQVRDWMRDTERRAAWWAWTNGTVYSNAANVLVEEHRAKEVNRS